MLNEIQNSNLESQSIEQLLLDANLTDHIPLKVTSTTNK